VKIIKKNNSARLGLISTPHGDIATPAFVPVATKGALRGISFQQAKADIYMMNTYHFLPRREEVKQIGGLHNFFNCSFPIMTDSGGFQVFSLGQARVDGVGKVGQQKKASSPSLTKIDEEGVSFVSLKDGSRFHLTPEDSIKVQEDLGADIIFAFDECTSPLANRDYTEQSMQRTHRWADRCLQAHSRSDQLLFGIIQGGRYLDLRKESSQFIASRNFGGFGIGGAFGEKEMQDVLSTIICFLPEEKPRHLLGIGEVEDIIIGVEQGIDLFDCVTPTRLARRGVALTKKGKINLRSSSWRSNYDKLGDYSYSYLHHLVREKEIYGIMLLVEHNLRFMMNLMEDIREAIRTDSWSSLRSSYLG